MSTDDQDNLYANLQIESTIKGRPRLEDVGKTLKATRPWEKLGMSERTWHRRRAELKRKLEAEQQQNIGE